MQEVLSGQVLEISTNVASNYDQFESIKTKTYKLGYQIKKVNTPLLKIIETLSDANTEWSQKRAALEDWAKMAGDEVSFQLVKEDILIQQKKVNQALALISKKLNPALSAQKTAFELEIKIHSLTLDIERLMQVYQKRSVKKSDSIFSSDFYSQINKNLLVSTWENAAMLAKTKWLLLVDHFNAVFILCMVIFSLSIFIRRSKKLVKASADWYLFTQRPSASAVFLCLAGLMLVNFFTEGDVQLFKNWETMWHIILLVSIIRLSGALLTVSWKKKCYFLIIISIMVIEFFRQINLPQVIFYLYAFFAALLMLIFGLRQIRQLSKQKISFVELLGLRLGVFTLSCILVMVISGFQEVALYLFFSGSPCAGV